MKSLEGDRMDPEAKVRRLELPETASTNTLEESNVGIQVGVLARLRHYESILDAKIGIESHGPKRILPEEKQPPNQWIMFIMWGSTADYTLGSINTGFLGVELGLSLPQCIVITLFGTLLGCMVAVSSLPICVLRMARVLISSRAGARHWAQEQAFVK